MRKIIIFILFIFLVTGCSIKKMDISNIDSVVDTILSVDMNLTNTVARGYKYYIPKGVQLLESRAFNEKLLKNDEYYYLYVDIVSYYNKKVEEYEVNEDAYFSKKIDLNSKHGYIEITQKGNLYFIEAMYNYAKVETFVRKENIETTIVDIVYILSSVKFNDVLTELILGIKDADMKEERLNIFVPKREEGSFLDFIEKYGNYEEETNNNSENILGKEND